MYDNINVKEWEIYHNFKPSIFQKIFWFFWPTMFYIKYKKYRDISIEDVSTM